MAKTKNQKRKRRKLRAVETVYKGGPKHVEAHAKFRKKQTQKLTTTKSLPTKQHQTKQTKTIQKPYKTN